MRKQTGIKLLLAALLSMLGFLAIGQAAALPAAQIPTSITIDGFSLSASCDQLTIHIISGGTAAGTPPMLHINVYLNSTLYANEDFTAAFPFQHTFPIYVAPGDSLTATASAGSANASAGPITCGGAAGGSTGSGNASPGDGRLNYTPDEYYALYCAYDLLEVWRGVPSGLMLATFPLTTLMSLVVGGTTASGGVTITRLNEDIYQAEGTNGNLAPAGGSKQFSMAACFAANGGEPAAAVPPPSNPLQTGPDYCSTAAGQANIFCYDDIASFCEANNYPAGLCETMRPVDSTAEFVENVLKCLFSLITPGVLGLAFLGLRRITRKQVIE